MNSPAEENATSVVQVVQIKKRILYFFIEILAKDRISTTLLFS